MKSKTNKRIKRVKKTLRTRRKLKKMRGGVFGEWWKKRQAATKKAYCEECVKKCSRTETPPPNPIFKPQPPSEQSQRTANGWYTETLRETGGDEFTIILLKHDNRKTQGGDECELTDYVNPIVKEYIKSIEKLPTPGESYTVGGDLKTVSLKCHKGAETANDKDRLVWVDTDNNEYPFDITNPLSIGGLEQPLVKIAL